MWLATCLLASGAWAGTCGNGILDPGETCDDGNLADGDCCSAICEPLSCAPAPSGAVAWEELGPSTLGGRVSALAVDPNDAQVLWAGTPAGGLWHSTDAGASWQTLAAWLAAIPLSAVAVGDAQELWIGTGQVSNGGSVAGALGVLRSTDGGANWTRGALERVSNTYVAALVAWPGPPARVVAATDLGIQLSLDGGVTFAETLRGDGISALVRDPFDADALYAAGRRGLLRSSDRGLTWVRLAAWPLTEADLYGAGTTALAVSSLTPGRLFAAVQVRASFDDTARVLLLTSADGGATLQPTGSVPELCPTPKACGFALSVAIHPADDQRLLVGGETAHVSGDGGASWSVLEGAAGVHDISPDAGGAYLGGKSGVARLNAAWTALEGRNDGLAVSGIVDLDVSGAGERLLAGTADGGSLLGAGAPPAWAVVHGARQAAGTARFDPFDAQRLYVSLSGGRFFRSDDGGGSFAPIFDGSVYKQAASEPAAFAASPLVPGLLFHARTQLFRSTDSGDAWSIYRPPGSPEVLRLAPSPFDPDRIYFTLGRGGALYKADDIHTERLDVSPNADLRLSAVLPDPLVQNVLYVGGVDTGSQRGFLAKSYDFGASWQDVTPRDLPAVSSLAKDPFGALYAGTVGGVFRSGDDGFSWSLFGEHLAYSGTTALGVGGDRLLAGTAGRGVFSTPLRRLVVIDSVPPGRMFFVDGQLVRGPFYAEWVPGSTHTVAPYLVQSADTRRAFDSWSDGGAFEHVVTAGSQNLSLIAAVRNSFRLGLAAEPPEGGVLMSEPSPADGFFLDGSFVSILAVPAADQRFIGFSGDVDGSQENLAYAVMSRPRSVSAQFAPLSVTLASEPPGLSLSIDGATVATPVSYRWDAGSMHSLAAPERVDLDPGDPYELVFEEWSDLLPREHSYRMLRDTFVTDLTARYIEVLPQLQVAAGTTQRVISAGHGDAARTATLRLDSVSSAPLPATVQVLRGTAEGSAIQDVVLVPAEAGLRHDTFVDGAAGRWLLVLHNPDAQPAQASVELRAADGTPWGTPASLEVPAGGRASAFVDELLQVSGTYMGALRVSADRPLVFHAHAQRENRRPSTFLDPALLVPFAPRRGDATQALLLSPDTEHQLTLLNDGDQALSGQVHLFDEQGAPLALDAGLPSVLDYNVAPQGWTRLRFRALPAAGPTRSAFARLTPAAGEPRPLLQLVERRQWAAVPPATDRTVILRPLPLARPAGATPEALRAPVDLARRDTGIVAHNPGTVPADVPLALRDTQGTLVGETTAALPPGQQRLLWVSELFPGLPADFAGVLETSAAGVDSSGVLRHVNGRGEELLTGFPLAAVGAATSVLPYAVDGDVWVSEWWLMGAPGADAVRFGFFDEQGQRHELPVSRGQ